MRKLIIVMISVFVLFLVFLSVIYIPKIKDNQEINRLKKEVSLVNNYITSNKGNINYIKDYINKDVTSGNRVVIEKAVDNYLNDIIDIYLSNDSINTELFNNTIVIDFNKDNIDNIINDINSNKDIINDINIKLDLIDVNNYIKSNNKNIINKYNNIIKVIDINNIKNNMDVSILDKKTQIINYLSSNKDYYNIDGKIIFIKRSKYNEFNDIVNSSGIKIDYELITDTIGPVINANNFYITEGDYLSLSDKIGCIDDVDDNVTCDISGSYNSNVVGVYTVNIKAKDSSNNTSSKEINVIVKEKEKYSLPYVIEVIRNQSTTIVYGRDDNGEYTRIVGVFPCSPGAGNNTPLGTFYSKRGVEWGSLFGGVYGQYSTVITGHVLFHSVPYHSTNKDDLVWNYYNQLGTKVSMGCIRLTVRDAKWIYDNCASGTMIKIYDGDLPSGVSKPEAQKIDGNDPRRGWDPTDPDPANPWNQ